MVWGRPARAKVGSNWRSQNLKARRGFRAKIRVHTQVQRVLMCMHTHTARREQRQRPVQAVDSQHHRQGVMVALATPHPRAQQLKKYTQPLAPTTP